MKILHRSKEHKEERYEDRFDNEDNQAPLNTLDGGVYMPGMSAEDFDDDDNFFMPDDEPDEFIGTDEERI